MQLLQSHGKPRTIQRVHFGLVKRRDVSWTVKSSSTAGTGCAVTRAKLRERYRENLVRTPAPSLNASGQKYTFAFRASCSTTDLGSPAILFHWIIASARSPAGPTLGTFAALLVK